MVRFPALPAFISPRPIIRYNVRLLMPNKMQVSIILKKGFTLSSSTDFVLIFRVSVLLNSIFNPLIFALYALLLQI
jgi:hypothetical protein